MAHQAGHTLPRTNPDGALPPVRPRLPGQGGAMSFMDTVADLVRRHRYLHDPARPEWQTAADVLAWAGDDLPDEVTDRLALSGLSTIGRPEFPGHRLSDGLADWVTAGSPEQSLASWRSWPPSDQHELLAQGLAEYARVMPTDDYELAYHSGDPYQARLLVGVGWVPSLLGAMVAGAVAAALADDLWLFPIVALAGLVLGCLATLGLWSAASDLDLRWHLFGRHWWTAAMLIVLVIGPAVAVLVAVVTLNLG
jgi:hypothetical protein